MEKISQITLIGNEIAREGLRQLIGDRGFEVAAWSIDQLGPCLSGLRDTASRLVIVDVMPDEKGVDVCKSIRQKLPNISILLFHGGGMTKARYDDIADSVDHIVARTTPLAYFWWVLDHIFRNAIDGGWERRSTEEAEPPNERHRFLSVREGDILSRLANGEANKIIAQHLDISEATVKVHVKTILRKLALTNRTQAAVWALRQGFVSLELVEPTER